MNAVFDPSAPAKTTDSIQVEMVRRVSTDEIIDVAEWLPKQTEGDTHQLRGQLRRKIDGEQFVCFCCGYPVYLKKHLKGGHYFAHVKKDDAEKAECIYQQDSQQSLKERDRIRYQGQRESLLHIQTKEKIFEILRADPSFRDVKVERVWNSFNDGWRKPDVAAIRDEIPIVFEAQVSNTYPHVVAERTDFYRSQNALLIWIHDKISNNSWRTMHSDNFCSNGQHLFTVNDECVCISKEKKEAHFIIYTQRPQLQPYQGDDNKWRFSISQNSEFEIVPFSRLSLNVTQQTATYFNIEREKWITRHKELCALVQADYSEIFYNELGQSIKEKIGQHRRIARSTLIGWAALICAIEGARLGKPIGTALPSVLGLFNVLYACRPNFIHHLVFTLEKLGLDKKFSSREGTWKNRVKLFRNGQYKVRELTTLPPQHLESIELLKCVYPELVTDQQT